MTVTGAIARLLLVLFPASGAALASASVVAGTLDVAAGGGVTPSPPRFFAPGRATPFS